MNEKRQNGRDNKTTRNTNERLNDNADPNNNTKGLLAEHPKQWDGTRMDDMNWKVWSSTTTEIQYYDSISPVGGLTTLI